MANIDSFKGTYDSGTGQITLTWALSDLGANLVIKVGEVNQEQVVASALRTTTLAGKPGKKVDCRIIVTDDDGSGNRTVGVLCKAAAAEETLEQPPYVNGGFEWLTYETVLNKPKFRKTNQSRKVGLYAADMAGLQLWVRSDIPPAAFNALCECFFPDHKPEEIRRLSDASWWWQQQQSHVEALKAKTAPYYEAITLDPPQDDIAAWLPDTRPPHVASRAVRKIFLPRYAVLPFNFYDNTEESRAIGARGSDSLHPVPMLQVKHNDGWDMWRTASRSSVMKLSRVKDPQVPWTRRDWVRWDFSWEGAKFRNLNVVNNVYVHRNPEYKAEVQKGQRLELANRDDYHFSVKTGVTYVGLAQQKEKENIGLGGEWLCGCMRSDTIRAIRQLAAARGMKKDEIIVQTEIMMLMERHMSAAMQGQKFGQISPGPDGVALRDLTVLEPGRYYIPPLSIPFIGKDMKTLTTEFVHVDEADWCGFWQGNWAEAVGRAKALFLVQYGMQHANPNVQNYLLEFAASPQDAFANFANGTATGPAVRVVIRDVADALLVREVAWALFGPNEACPHELGGGLSDDIARRLGAMRLPVLRFNFRNKGQGAENETGSTNEQFGTPGIQFLWTRFSGFYVGNKENKNDECPPDKLQKVLRLTSQWGLAHAAAYVRTVEKALGVEFGDIRWDQVLDDEHHPDRFLQGVANDWDRFSKADMAWEEAAASIIQTYFRDAGRAKLCAYHNRGWADAPATFSIRVVDQAGKALPLQVVYCSEPGTGKLLGTRITDPAGEIPFFAKSYAEYKFWISSGKLQAKAFPDAVTRMAGDEVALDKLRDDGATSVLTPHV